MKAVRTKKILSPKGLFQNAIYTWGLSGSLMPNTPIDLYPVMRTIGHKQIGKFTDWFKFTGRFCGRFRGKWGWDVSGAKNIDDLSRRLFKTGLALRRAKEDVIEELPSRQYRLIRLEPDTRAIGEPVLWNDDLKKTEWCSGSPGLGAGELAELRAAMALAKLDMVITYIKEQLETERKLVIFTWHRVVTETLVNTFQNSVAYYGGMNANQKEEAKSKFTHGNVQLFIANIASAGTGIDGLQRVCSHAIFVEIPWTYAEVMQATDRLWRIGQENHVLADILVVRGSNEQYILKQVFKKEKFFRDLLLTSG